MRPRTLLSRSGTVKQWLVELELKRSGDCYRGQPAEPEGRLNSSAFRPVLLGGVVFGFFALWLSPRQQAKRLLASKSQAELECRYS
jgi:hypothetical protein